MAYYTDDMNQVATYWAPLGLDAFGKPTYSAPITIACRWQDKVDLVRDANGRQVVSMAIVYPAQPVRPQGWMALGDLTATADPRNVSAASEIIAVGSSPDLDEDLILLKAWL